MIDFYDPDLYDLEVGISTYREHRRQFYVQEGERLGSPILELGCGTGSILLALAKRGLRVTGLDISESMLDRCRQKAETESEHIRSLVSLCQGDMERLELPERFAGVFIPYHAVFHLRSPEALEACFTRVFDHLLPGGELIFDVFVPNPNYLGPLMQQDRDVLKFVGETETPQGTCRVYQHEKYDAITQRLISSFRYELLNEGQEVVKVWYRTLDYRLASAEELRLQLLRCGFGFVSSWGAFDRNTPIDPSQDIVIQAKKVTSPRDFDIAHVLRD